MAESINIRQYDILFELLNVAREMAYSRQIGVEYFALGDSVSKLVDLVDKYEKLK